MKVRDVIRMLEKDGWFLGRTRRSHRQFHQAVKPGTVTIAGQVRVDMPKGTLNKCSQASRIEELIMRYGIVVEKGETSYGAYVPDLPGCVAVGKTRSEALALIKEAIQLHLDDLRGRGQRLPRPEATVEYVEVLAA